LSKGVGFRTLDGMILADILSVTAWCAILALALRYRTLSGPEGQWPMQWGLDGKPTWRARRDVAVFFHPVFFGFMLAAFAVRAGEGEAPADWIAIRIASAGLFVLTCRLHLRFASRGLSPT
jgi:hypothetical protein